MKAAMVGTCATLLLIAVVLVGWRFNDDVERARARAERGSVTVQTRCGQIEYQEAGTGVPMLMIHGSGGGHDQGMAFAREMSQHGIRVIAMSRFGYLRTPMPIDGSPAAQADAHVCLLDALGISRAGVVGVSAGALSAMQTAIRHPDRVSALALVVPIAYKPDDLADSAPPLSPWVEKQLMRLIDSDFLFWIGLKVAHDQIIKTVLATPPEQVALASPKERDRVNAMAETILPVSARADGLRADSDPDKSKVPYRLETIRAPTLIISARDDGYGTYAAAAHTASRIAGARFIGFETGGHVLVGHDEEVRWQIVQWLTSLGEHGLE